MKSGKRFVLCGVTACMFGCSAPGAVDAGSGSSGSDDAGPDIGECVWNPSFGGITVPECTEHHTTIFQGTVDGKPYNKTFSGTSPDYDMPLVGAPPYKANLMIPAATHLYVEWHTPYPDVAKQFSPIDIGVFIALGEETNRLITHDSWLRLHCTREEMALIVNFEGGQLAVCSSQ